MQADVTHTLDEGKLILEVKATGQGLVPELDRVLKFKPPGFTIVETDDKGLAISQFDPDADDTVVVSQRNWMTTMRAAQDAAAPPTEFHFATPELDGVTMTRQRYVDADLLNVDEVVSFAAAYHQPDHGWLWWAAGGTVLGIGGLVAASRRRRPQAPVDAARFQLPDDVTPFTVLGLLRNIQQNDRLDDHHHRERAAAIDGLERHNCAAGDGQEPNLAKIAESWIDRSAKRPQPTSNRKPRNVSTP